MNKTKNINLQLLSSIVFIISSLVSVSITYNEKLNLENKDTFYTENEALNISFYNRIVILISVLISLYVAYTNYLKQETDKEKYKSGLLLLSNLIVLISASIILYISYLNKKEKTLTAADTQNTLI